MMAKIAKPGYRRKKVVYRDLAKMIKSIYRHKELYWTVWKTSFKFFRGQPLYTLWYFK